MKFLPMLKPSDWPSEGQRNRNRHSILQYTVRIFLRSRLVSLKQHIYSAPTRQLFLFDMAGHGRSGAGTYCRLPTLPVCRAARAGTAALPNGQDASYEQRLLQEQPGRGRHPRQVHGTGPRPRWRHADFAFGESHLCTHIGCAVQPVSLLIFQSSHHPYPKPHISPNYLSFEIEPSTKSQVAHEQTVLRVYSRQALERLANTWRLCELLLRMATTVSSMAVSIHSLPALQDLVKTGQLTFMFSSRPDHVPCRQ